MENTDHPGQALLPCYYDERVMSIIGQETPSPELLLGHAVHEDVCYRPISENYNVNTNEPMDISEGMELADSENNSDDDAGMTYSKQSPPHSSTPYSKRIREDESSVTLGAPSGSKRRVKRSTLLSNIINVRNQRIEKPYSIETEPNNAILKASEAYNETLKKVVENTLNLDNSIHEVAVAVKIGCEKIAEAMYDVATTGLNQISDVLLNGVGNHESVA